MKLMSLLLALTATFSTHANLHQAPPTLSLNGGANGIFVDFQTASSVVTYDIAKREAKAVTTITFKQESTGMPIFDLVPNPSSLKLDGKDVTSKTTSMNGESTIRYIESNLEAGTYTLEVENEISTNLSWSYNDLKSAFWMSDLSDRRYLEQYLPTNLEYDQYQTNLEAKIVGTDVEHVLYTNGTVQEVAINHWRVAYPAVYTASSYFFHITKKGLIPEEKSTYKSIDGRDIPFTVYTTQSTSRFMNEALKVVAELERDYGPFPHQQVIIYGAGLGGMEHCGATITSYSALGHELTHSYFARGVMPAHGNSGWVDEAIASWRDEGYPSYSSRSLSRTDMAGHSVYQRTTDRDAYSKGMRFIGYLNDKFQSQESFKLFLKSFFQERKFKPFKTYEFKEAIETYYNTDLNSEFDTYIYGKKGIDKDRAPIRENPYHPRLSPQELLDLL